MNITKISNLHEYHSHLESNKIALEQLKQLDAKLVNQIKQTPKFYIEGFSWTAQSESQFLVDMAYADHGQVNIRERLVCQKTKLNNRIRGCIQIFESVFNPQKDDAIYLTEQRTLLAKWLSKKYHNLIGSEFMEDCSWFTKLKLSIKSFPEKINHQDLTALTLPSDYFKFTLSFDCFEHSPNYKKAFSEVYRTLKSGGSFLFSVPFDINSEKTLVRAEICDGEIKHLTEPEYHGNPVSKLGSLSFYTFGWVLLDELKSIGFKNVYILLFWSEKYANLGGEQIMICAEK